MRYNSVVKAVFLDRPNRFIANVTIGGRTETVHVKNTGRCRELLVPGSTVYLEHTASPQRKTAYDLISVEKQRDGLSPLMINMDSQLPNRLVEEWLPDSGLFSEGTVIKREVAYGNSRFDLCLTAPDGKVSYMEVKGVTLERDGIVFFPDAPTLRGLKHVRELIKCRQEGFGAYILFVVQMTGASELRPNYSTHREFGEVLREAVENGVCCLAADCIVTPDTVTIKGFIPVVTDEKK